jgi:thiamine-monophosphate kinase
VAGDVVYVTGRFGGPAAAVTAWRAGREPDPAARARFAGPVPRCREGRWLAAHGATAAVDVADGLVSDLDHLAAASAVRIAIDLEQVPRLAGVSPVEAGRAGEEYELAVTAPPDLDCQAFTDRFGIPLTPIGTVAPRRHDGRASRLEICVKGQRVDPPVGYDHFSP